MPERLLKPSLAITRLLMGIPIEGAADNISSVTFSDGTEVSIFDIPAKFAATEDDDVLTGDQADDVIEALGGDDILDGGAGADLLDGGEGQDTASYEGSVEGVTIALDGAVSGGDAEGDVLVSIENLTGSAFGDALTGTLNESRPSISLALKVKIFNIISHN